MKKLFYLCCLVFTIQATAQPVTSWFRSYTGTIGKTTFTLLLHKAGYEYEGFVYYAKTQLPYTISAQNQRSSTIQLTGSPTDNSEQEKWKLTITGTAISGSFTLRNKTTALTAREANLVPGAGFVFTEKTEKLNPADKHSPAAKFYQSGIWFASQSPLNKLLWKADGQKTAGQYFLENRNEFMKEYREEYKDITREDYKEGTYMYSRESLSKLMISYVSEHLLVFTENNYMYLGGAHGNFGAFYQVVDKRSNTTLELTQLIQDTAALVPLLEKHYRRLYNVPEGQTLTDAGLFVNTIPVSENFFLTEKYLCFTYNPYEIAPYAGGEVTICIPFEEFSELLTTSAKGIFMHE